MFREGRHVQKKSAAMKLYISFPLCSFIDFSEQSKRNWTKNMEHCFVQTKKAINQVWNACFSPKSRFLIDFWCPSGSPGASRDVPGGHPFFHWSSVGCENQPGPGPWRLQNFHFKSYGFHFKSYGFHFKPYVFHFKPYNFHFKSYGWYCFYAMLTPLSSLSQLNN